MDLDDPNEGESNQDDMDTMDESEDAESDFSPEDVVLDDDAAGEESSDGDATTVEMDAHADMDESAAESDPDEAAVPMPDDAGRIPVDINYNAYTEKFDEIIRAEELCDADEMIRLRQLLDQQLVALQHATSKLANRLQRRLMAKQNRTWEFDLEEGVLDLSLIHI